jgi:Spy/CpxP family protein refolding chaperone
MRKVILLSAILMLGLILFSACNQQEPVAQEPAISYQTDQAGALYLLGNEEPIEAEQPASFLFHGPGPFFLWALDLTDEQKDQLRLIGEQHRSEMRGQIHDMMRNGDREALKEAHAALREEMLEKIKEILTDEQKAILEEIQNQIDAGQYPMVVIDKRVAALTESLNLTAEQQNSVRNLMEVYGAELLQLRAQNADPRTMHEQSRQILDEYIEALKALLDEDQLILFEDLQAEFKANHPRGTRRGRHGK